MAKRTMEIVSRIGQMNLDGNIIPHAWFNHLKFSNGKPNVNAAILLSEIVYWYRPITIKDEATGRVIETRRKFKADKLQRSYDSFAQQFGFTKRQVKEALKYLEDQGIITLEFRHITAQSGVKLANVLFIEPIPAKLEEITHLTLERNTSDAVASDIYSSNGIHLTTECQTNTETPTQTPTDTMDDLPFSENPLAGLPPGIDGQQRAIDRANGGGGQDATELVAAHLHSGFMGAPVPLPADKRELKKLSEAARRLLAVIPPGWEIRAVCQAIDSWWQHPDDFWWDKPCHDETLGLIAKHYVKLQATPTPPPPSPLPPPTELETLWARALNEMRGRMTAGAYNQYLAGTQAVQRDNGRLVISAPAPHILDWLDQRGRKLIEPVLAGRGISQVEFVVAGDVRPVARAA